MTDYGFQEPADESEDSTFNWDKELSSLTSVLGKQNFLAEAEIRDKIMAAGEALGVNTDKQYTEEQTEFLVKAKPYIDSVVRNFFKERWTSTDSTNERWFGDFAFTSFSYDGEYLANVSYHPSRNDKVAVITFNIKSMKTSPLTGNPVEIWTTIETIKLDLVDVI